MTAREAWAFAWPEAEALDARARLVLVTSGTDIRTDGRSFTWEFLLHLPARRASLLLSLAPAEDAPDPEQAPVVMTKRVTRSAASEPARALALDFRDSPEAVAELGRAGVDFVSGRTDMKLEARFVATGAMAWVTYDWDDERWVALRSPDAGSQDSKPASR